MILLNFSKWIFTLLFIISSSSFFNKITLSWKWKKADAIFFELEIESLIIILFDDHSHSRLCVKPNFSKPVCSAFKQFFCSFIFLTSALRPTLKLLQTSELFFCSTETVLWAEVPLSCFLKSFKSYVDMPVSTNIGLLSTYNSKLNVSACEWPGW